MTGWPFVRARRLRLRKLVSDDATIQQATLFPFFDGAGIIERVLVVDADSSELRSIELEKSRLRIFHWGPIQLEGRCTILDDDDIQQLAPLWHFDPWWLLKEARYDDHPAVPILKRTNCVEAFDQLPNDLVFSSRLAVVRKVSFAVPTNEYKSCRFDSDMLPMGGPEQSTAAETPAVGWVLDPIWAHLIASPSDHEERRPEEWPSDA